MASLRQLGDTRYHRGDDTQQPEDRESQSGRVSVCLHECVCVHDATKARHIHTPSCAEGQCVRVDFVWLLE